MTLWEVQAQQIKYNSYQCYICPLYAMESTNTLLLLPWLFVECESQVMHSTSNVVTSVTEQEMRVTLDQAVKCVKEEYLLPEQYGLIPRPT